MKWCLLVLALACGASDPAPVVPAPVQSSAPAPAATPATADPRPIASDAEAIARVDEVFPGVVNGLEGDSRHAVAVRWLEALPDASRAASRGRCSELGARFTDTMGPGAHAEAVLFGDLDALAAGDCWTVWISLGFQTLAVAFDAESGALRFVWDVPEG